MIELTRSSSVPLESQDKASIIDSGALDLAYLQAQLERIDILIRQQVERWQQAGQDPLDAFRGLYVSDSEARHLAHRPFGHGWGHLVTLPPERISAHQQDLAEADTRIRSLQAQFNGLGLYPRLEYLATVFGLDRFDLTVLLICLAPSLDLRYERLYGYLQDDVSKKRPSVNLALDLLCAPGVDHMRMLTRFADDSPLFKYLLIEKTGESASDNAPVLSQILSVDPSIVSWLLGRFQPQAGLGRFASLELPQADPTIRLLAGSALPGLLEASKDSPLIALYGADHNGKEAAARLLAASLNRLLLSIDLAGVLANSKSVGGQAYQAIWLALRDARLTGAIPFLYGWDACLPPDGLRIPSADILAELVHYPDLVIVAGEAFWRPGGMDRQRRMIWKEFPTPAYAQRFSLWQHFLGDENLDVQLIAGQFKLNPSQIRDAVAAARDRVAQEGLSLDSAHLFAAARAYSNPNLATLARKITPRYDWIDIILPADQIAQLTEIITTVRGRPMVLDDWGVGKKLTSSQGVTILFAGPPGTGKTMAAEVIARELGLDLFKIDLSTVVSKYIGETEKNLEKIFHEAASSNAILFFDEADAIFGKRSEVKDAHDRYANIEVSYLLQRMEAYDGVTILATNLRANLDDAFTRRLQFAIDFPFPEEADRLRIWQSLFPQDLPRGEELDFQFMARRFKLAGGNIRNIIVSAAFLAAADEGAVKMVHLLHGARRELQKMGRLVED